MCRRRQRRTIVAVLRRGASPSVSGWVGHGTFRSDCRRETLTVVEERGMRLLSWRLIDGKRGGGDEWFSRARLLMALVQHSATASFRSLPPGKTPVIRRQANSGDTLKLPGKLGVAPRYLHYRLTARCQHPLGTCESLAPKEEPVVIRRDGNFHQAVWDDQFIASLTTYDEETVSSSTQRIGELKEKVKHMLRSSTDQLKIMNLIDSIERLGISYHFEKDIQAILKHLYEDGDVDDSLHAITLRFRLLRQQGYYVPCDVFDKFKDKDGKLKLISRNDVRGLLSLFEASQHRIVGEDILDEALTFTKDCLKSMCIDLDPALSRHLEHALALPLHKSVTRLETRHYISFYEADELKNDVLLELAKLEFNVLQSLHRSELKEVTKWRKDMDFVRKLPFARDRVVELYLWALEMNYLPQFSQGRIALAKFFNLLPLIDDTYDVYGTLEELERYTDAICRWDLTTIDQLPEYMKLSYIAVYNILNEIEYISLKNRGSSGIHHLRKMWEDQCKGYMQEARWFYHSHIPGMDEYLKVGSSTSCAFVLFVITAIGMGEMVTKEDLDYITGGTKLPWLLSLVIRFTDDLGTSKDEHARGDVAKIVQCYMKDQGVSEEVAREHIKNWNEETWKEINQEILKPLPLPKPLIKGMVNLARLCETFYLNGNDGLGNSQRWTVDLVNSLFFDPIKL